MPCSQASKLVLFVKTMTAVMRQV